MPGDNDVAWKGQNAQNVVRHFVHLRKVVLLRGPTTKASLGVQQSGIVEAYAVHACEAVKTYEAVGKIFWSVLLHKGPKLLLYLCGSGPGLGTSRIGLVARKNFDTWESREGLGSVVEVDNELGLALYVWRSN
jgi:hypothetical protein